MRQNRRLHRGKFVRLSLFGITLLTASGSATTRMGTIQPTLKEVSPKHLNVSKMVHGLQRVAWEPTSSLRGDPNGFYSNTLTPAERHLVVTNFRTHLKEYREIVRNIMANPSLNVYPVAYVLGDILSIQRAYQQARESEQGQAFMRAAHTLHHARSIVRSLRARLDFDKLKGMDDPEMKGVVSIYEGLHKSLPKIPIADIDHLVGQTGRSQLKDIRLRLAELKKSPIGNDPELIDIFDYGAKVDSLMNDKSFYLGDISKHLVDKLSMLVALSEVNKLHRLNNLISDDALQTSKDLEEPHQELLKIEGAIVNNRNMPELSKWYKQLNRGLSSSGFPQKDLPPLFDRLRKVLPISLDN